MVRLAKPVRFSSHASRRRQLLIQPAICLGHLELGGLNWQPILISPIHPIQSGYTQPLITIILLKPKSQSFNQKRVTTTVYNMVRVKPLYAWQVCVYLRAAIDIDSTGEVSFVVVTGMNHYYFHYGRYDTALTKMMASIWAIPRWQRFRR